MSKVVTRIVEEDEDGIRLDRWFKRHYPALPHGQFEKLLRTGQIRVNGARVKTGARVEAWQAIRIPPHVASEDPKKKASARPLPKEEIEYVQSLVLHRDPDVIGINKPSGLAVQGGSKTNRHLDGMLDGLQFEADERPKLVHRLDRDTSGVLLLARTARSASALTKAFRENETEKIYWGLCVGVPKPEKGVINLPLIKEKGGPKQDFKERVKPAPDGHPDAKEAVTYYSVIAKAGGRVAWVAMRPITGRTHQLRAHMAAIGHPLVGDTKYGDERAISDLGLGNRPLLHLHAQSLSFFHPNGSGRLTLNAPLPEHMRQSWEFLEFNAEEGEDPFAELEL